MNKLLLSATVIAILISYSATGQYSATRLCNESMKLNGGVRAQLGGVSRSYIPITVPQGATHIAVSISISPTEQLNSYALTANLVGLLATASPSTLAGILNSLQGEPGYGVIDMHLYNNSQCVNLFISKAYQQCNPLYWRQNSGGGVFHYAVPYPGQYYLCFRNPSETSAVWFHVEATAIVPEDTKQNDDGQTLEELVEYRKNNIPEYTKEELKEMMEYYRTVELKK